VLQTGFFLAAYIGYANKVGQPLAFEMDHAHLFPVCNG